MDLQQQELLFSNSPSLFLVQTRERDIDIFSQQISLPKNVVVRIIRGKRCQSTNELFHEFSAALQFPYYFGNNWDGFDECLCDLSWLKSTKYIYFITDTNALLQNEKEKEVDILLKTLTNAVSFWQTKGFMKIVFQTEKKVNQKIQDVCQLRTLKPFDNIK